MTDLMFPVIKQVMGMELRRRWYRHCGSKSEVLRTLAEYGLEDVSLPKVLGGSWTSSADWIAERRIVERARAAQEAVQQENEGGEEVQVEEEEVEEGNYGEDQVESVE